MTAFRARSVALASAALLATGSGGAFASSAFAAESAPTPDPGPVSGGTVITMGLPDSSLDAVNVEAGIDNSYVLTADGTMLSAGSSLEGALGNGAPATDWSYQGTLSAMIFPDDVTVSEITGGDQYAFAETSSGIYAWGEGNYGEDGSAPGTSSTPSLAYPSAGDPYVSVSAGWTHVLALDADGTAYGFGANGAGQLGNGTMDTAGWGSTNAIPVTSSISFTEVFAGAMPLANATGQLTRGLSYAVGGDGNVYAWGSNWYGRLGDGTNIDRSTPTKVALPDEAAPVVARDGHHVITGGSSSAYALDSAGVLWAWGSDTNGRLGNGGDDMWSYTPVKVTAPAGVTFVSVDSTRDSVIALGSDGNAYTWGDNDFGELGNGSLETRNVPTKVVMPAGVKFTDVSAAGFGMYAIGDDGKAYAWGRDNNGQLGLNTPDLPSDTATYLTPTAMVMPTRVVAGVTVDGIATDFTDNGGGTVSATTPAHVEGTVDVVVTTALSDGSGERTTSYAQSFTYLADEASPTPSPSDSVTPDPTASTDPGDSQAPASDAPVAGVGVDTGGELSNSALPIATLLVAGGAAATAWLVKRRQ